MTSTKQLVKLIILNHARRPLWQVLKIYADLIMVLLAVADIHAQWEGTQSVGHMVGRLA